MVSVASVVLEAFMRASENGALKSSIKRGLRSELVVGRWISLCWASGKGILRLGFREAIVA